jgi:two-component system, OmpR family, phosphate regulon response regulator OmpR
MVSWSDRAKSWISSRKQSKQARSNEFVATILEAAVQVLAKEGAKRFTTARVAEKAGVSVGSLYQYFPNKSAILFRLQSDEWRQTAQMLCDILEDSQRPPLERLRRLVHAFIQSECDEAANRAFQMFMWEALPKAFEEDCALADDQRTLATALRPLELRLHRLETAMQRILLIEDDVRLAEMLNDYLGGEGYVVSHVASGSSGLQLLARNRFDAIVLDVMLPDIDGLEVCRQVRQAASTPILMLTARGDSTDRIIGLELGADDYLPKPFVPRELLARLRAILRRGGDTQKRDLLVFGRLEIDRGARTVRVDGLRRTLTGYQFELLVALAERRGRVMAREALMDLVKGEALEAFDRSIDVHISRIRACIEDDPKNPRRIITVRSAGYVFARTQD